MSDFSIAREMKGEVALVRVQGFLDAHTFEQLEEEIRDVYDSGCFKLVVDLSKVDYISSAGAGVFIGARSEGQENGGDVIILNPTAGVKEVLELLGLTQIFKVYDDYASALASF